MLKTQEQKEGTSHKTNSAPSQTYRTAKNSTGEEKTECIEVKGRMSTDTKITQRRNQKMSG